MSMCECGDHPCSVYLTNCVSCCARLIRKSRPNRDKQNAMLQVIQRHKCAPTLDEIKDEIKKQDASHAS